MIVSRNLVTVNTNGDKVKISVKRDKGAYGGRYIAEYSYHPTHAEAHDILLLLAEAFGKKVE